MIDINGHDMFDDVSHSAAGKDFKSSETSRIQKATKILSRLNKQEQTLSNKLTKTTSRIGLVSQFMKEASGTDIKFRDWMKDKGLDVYTTFGAMGFYCPEGLVATDDAENKSVLCLKGFSPQESLGHSVPKANIVSDKQHDEITSSANGVSYNRDLALYFPTVYESNTDVPSDNLDDVIGGVTLEDVGEMTNMEDYGIDPEDYVDWLEQEGENVTGEIENVYVGIDGTLKKVREELEYSNANGLNTGILRAINRELTPEQYSNLFGGKISLRSKTNPKRVANVQKAAVKKEERGGKSWLGSTISKSVTAVTKPRETLFGTKEQRVEKREVRKDKRENKRDLKAQLKSGKISKSEYNSQKKEVKKVAREKIRAAGGTLFGKLTSPLKKAGLAPVRNSYLGIVRLNGFGQATKLAWTKKNNPKQYSRIKDSWKHVFGGSPDSLEKTFLKGAEKKPLGRGKKFKSGQYSSVTGVEEVAALATLASTVIATFSGMLKGSPETSADEYFAPEEISDGLAGSGLSPEQQAMMRDIADGDTDLLDEAIESDKKNSTMAYLIFGGLGLATIAVVALLIKKFKK